ncbi:unnamed protein product [Enterobius vermicularis]|uniref:THO complex subunit 5 n=1 Tax=Enterobius vermicularis TaxID=51028 RepID=A0A0N4V4W4_ENTVE|nr:unnamed protein product [Enterobius vermicularis]
MASKSRAVPGGLPKKRVEQTTVLSVPEFYALEDAESVSLDWESMKSSFLERSALIKSHVDLLANPEISEADLKNSEEIVLHQLMLLRRLNRFAMYRNRHGRDVASEMLNDVDSKYLQLQNANNEIEHIRKEIERSADEDIDLVPIEEFYDKAPQTLSREEVTRTDMHEQRIARLNWEMAERKNLVATLQEREGRKNVLLSDISKKEYRLKSLKPKIEALIETARPVQELMSLRTASSVLDSQHPIFSYLAKELTVVAVQTEAYRDIAEDDGVIVECQGDIESAAKFYENHSQQSAEPEDEDNYSDTANGTVSPAQSLKRRRSTASERITRKKDLLLTEHPVSLVITVRCDGTFLIFRSLLCDESLLIGLFPNDDGEKCSDVVGQVKLEHLGITVQDYEPKIGRFFKFARRMAGIDQGDSEATCLCDTIQSVISEIRYRVRTRSALIRCIKNLSLLKVFEEMPKELRSQFPSRVVSRLSEFRMLTPSQFLAHEAVTEDYKKLLTAESSSSFDNHFFFSATIERNSAVLTALIYIPTCYPKYRKPVYILFALVDGALLTAKNCSALKDIEANINLMQYSNFECKQELELYAQMGFLISRFDCFLEIQGRDRQIPLAFDNTADAFTFL